METASAMDNGPSSKISGGRIAFGTTHYYSKKSSMKAVVKQNTLFSPSVIGEQH
jgi:hypothetical protein